MTVDDWSLLDIVFLLDTRIASCWAGVRLLSGGVYLD